MVTNYRLVTLPRALAELLTGPIYRRPKAATVDEAVRWVQHVLPEIKGDKRKRTWAKELLLLRWLVDVGRVSDGRP